MSTYLEPYRQPDGTVMVPTRAESDDGRVVGVGFQPLREGDEQYQEWRDYVDALEADDQTAWDGRLSNRMD